MLRTICFAKNVWVELAANASHLRCHTLTSSMVASVLHLISKSPADAVERYMPEALREAIEDLQDLSAKYHRQEAVSGQFDHLPVVSSIFLLNWHA